MTRLLAASLLPSSKTLRINYDKYHEVVGKMLAKTLEVQYQGDKTAADDFDRAGHNLG